MKITDFQMLYDNVLVKGITIKEKGGVLTADAYEDKPELGEVVSLGTGRILENGETLPIQIKEGDVVYFNSYSATKFNIDGDDYFVVRSDDVMGFKR